MAIDDFTVSELQEIYRRGIMTAKKIAGAHAEEEPGYKKVRTVEHFQGDDKNNELYKELALYPFFGGIKEETVVKYKPRINYWFNNYREAAAYTEESYKTIKSDPKMLQHGPKIKAAIDNAKEFQHVVEEYGNFIDYIFSFKPNESKANLYALMNDFQRRFKQYGPTITKQYLKDLNIGLPLIKPDLNIIRMLFSTQMRPAIGTSKAAT